MQMHWILRGAAKQGAQPSHSQWGGLHFLGPLYGSLCAHFLYTYLKAMIISYQDLLESYFQDIFPKQSLVNTALTLIVIEEIY